MSEILNRIIQTALTEIVKIEDAKFSELENALLRADKDSKRPICPWCDQPVVAGTSPFVKSHWPSCPKPSSSWPPAWLGWSTLTDRNGHVPKNGAL